MDTNELIRIVNGCAIEVKKTLGVGFLEHVYLRALQHELDLHGIYSEVEVSLDVRYKGKVVGSYRADLLVEKCLIIETKVVSEIISAHELQLVNYLKATGINDGLIINFGVTPLEIRRKFRESRIY